MNPYDVVASALTTGLPPQLVARAERVEGVTLLTVEQVGARLQIDALVRDVDVQAVSLTVHGDTGGITVSCGCEAMPQCLHTAATLAAALREDDTLREKQMLDRQNAAPRGGARRGDTRRPWQRDLDDALPPPSRGVSSELCLFVRVETDGFDSRSWRRVPVPPRIVVRPGTRGARGAWIKGDADWSRFSRLPAAPAALDLMRELEWLTDEDGGDYYYAEAREWRPLDGVASRSLWSLLSDLDRSGVPLVAPGKRRHPVRLDGAPATVRLTAVEHRSRLRIQPQLILADGSAWPGGDDDATAAPLLIGSPAIAVAATTGVGTADESIVLHRFDEPVPDALRKLLARSPLSIERAGREAFEQSYLPRLRALAPIISPDGSYTPPEPPDPVLVLVVRHSEHQTGLAWSWDRGHAEADPQPEREAGIVAAVLAAADGIGLGADSPPTTTHAGAPRAAGAQTPAGGATTPPDRILGRSATAAFVAEVLPRLREIAGLRIEESGTASHYRASDAAPRVAVAATGRDDDWFDLDVTVTVDGETVEFAELFAALTRGEARFVLPSGTYFPLQTPELERLREIIAEASALSDRPVTHPSLSRYQVDLWDELADVGVVAAREAQWWLALQALSSTDELPLVAAPPTLRAELRDYQQFGYSWLTFLRRHGLGGILADDMGLGKTLQTIALMEQARIDDPGAPPFLVVAPTSVVGNWARECARFAPGLVVRTIDATRVRRGMTLAEVAEGAHVIVVSYALLRLEADDYSAQSWSGLILDEAQQIKNPASRGYRAARAIDAPFTLVVTGTPLENHLLDLWALVSLACPGLLGTRTRFSEFFRVPIERGSDRERLLTLQRRLRPFLLRRTKDLVAAELPPKQQTVLEVDLHPTHRRLYDRRLHRERQKLLGLVDDMSGNGFQIFRSLTLLRQLALDPRLVDEGEAPVAKLDAMVELLVEAAAEGHRVLVLSQFTRFLRSAREAATEAGLETSYLDGETTNRQRVIDDFRAGAQSVFFVSLKAGGVGLNLVEADYVVLLDPWWNPAVEAQAVDRAHRLGQTRPVFVYRLVARDTIEQKVVALNESKSRLFDRVLDEGGAWEPGRLTADDIRGLLD